MYREDAPSKAEADFDAAIDKAYDARWWETHDNVTITAYWMVAQGFEAQEIAYLVEKPWKFTVEWLNAEAAIEDDGGEGAWLEGTDEDDPQPDDRCSKPGGPLSNEDRAWLSDMRSKYGQEAMHAEFQRWLDVLAEDEPCELCGDTDDHDHIVDEDVDRGDR